MTRLNPILKSLKNPPYEVIWKPKGNSMTPKIMSGQQVKVIYINPSLYRINDIVYAKVKGNYYLHLISAIDETKKRFQISNNHGHVNGWATIDNMYGLCIEVDGKVIVSQADLNKR